MTGTTTYERYQLARSYFDQKLYANAATELEAVLMDAARPDGDVPMLGTGEARLLLARSYYHSAQLRRAEAASRQIIESDPDEVYAVLLLARTLERTGRRAEASGWLRRAAALGADVEGLHQHAMSGGVDVDADTRRPPAG